MVVAANRDEYLARPATAPELLNDDPIVIGGKDLKAGGTWLGVNQYGLVAGLLNRRASGSIDPARRSRGLLCLEALRYRAAGDALRFVTAQNGAAYNSFNLLIASRDEAFVAYNRRDEVETSRMEPGVHLLTNLDVDDFECPKISHAYDRFAALAGDPEFCANPIDRRDLLSALLADHATQLDSRSSAPNAICVHLDGYGTRSSSLIFIDDHGAVQHFFAAGSPCTARYQPAPTPSAR